MRDALITRVVERLRFSNQRIAEISSAAVEGNAEGAAIKKGAGGKTQLELSPP